MIEVNVDQLKNAINQSLPSEYFAEVILKVSNGVLKVISFDFSSYSLISIDVLSKYDGDFVVLVNRKGLLNILETVGSEYVSLRMGRSLRKYLIIEDDMRSYTLLSYETSFKICDLDRDINDGIVLSSDAIINAIDKVTYVVDKNRLRCDICKSIGFIFENGDLFIASVGRRRLAVCDLKAPNKPNNLNIRIGIPLYLKRILKKDKDVLFNIIDSGNPENPKMAAFKSDNITFFSIIEEHEYSDVLNIVNSWRQYLAIDLKLSKEIMVNILQLFVAEERDDYPIKLTLKNNNLNILSLANSKETQNKHLETIEIDAVVNYTGDEYVIGFDALDLLEALNNIDSDDVILRLPSDKDGIAYIEPVDNCNCLAMVNPIKLP